MRAMTKAEVTNMIEGDERLVLSGLVFLYFNQVEVEREVFQTIYKNLRGFSMPLAPEGTALAEIVRDGGKLDADQVAAARGICAYHWRQVAILVHLMEGVAEADVREAYYPTRTPRRAPLDRNVKRREQRFRERVAVQADVGAHWTVETDGADEPAVARPLETDAVASAFGFTGTDSW